jgi:hypothetical protein
VNFSKGEISMDLSFNSFAGQNWLITPAALAVNEVKPSSISEQKWLLVLTGVGILDLKGNNPDDWRRETLVIFPDIGAPLQFAVDRFSIPRPVGQQTQPAFNLDQWAPFAAISAIFDRDTGTVDAGYAVDIWRPNHFFDTADAGGNPVHNIFTGIAVDVAVRNDKAVLHRVSYHITLLGKIVFLTLSGV